MDNTYQQIGKEYLEQYTITLCPRSTCKCWTRTHAHVKERKLCKIDLPKTRAGLFEFLHEVGHVVAENANYTSSVPRSLAEYNATKWGIKEMQSRHIRVPRKKVEDYNRYVRNKLGRGLRRGLQNVPLELLPLLSPMQRASLKQQNRITRKTRKGVKKIMAMSEARKAYMNSDKGKAARKRYQESEKGKAARAKYMAKRAAAKKAKAQPEATA